MSRAVNSVLLVGDIILDIHHFGMGEGQSIEAPIPVGSQRTSVLSWGGAGLVARNLLSLGRSVVFVSVIGKDRYGAELQRFSHKNMTKKFIVNLRRSTTVKERFLINDKKVLRWNHGDHASLSRLLEADIKKLIKRELPQCDKVLVSDYRHGCISRSLAAYIVKEAHAQGKKVYVDSQVTRNEANHRWYSGADLICVNEKEACALDPSFDTKDLPQSLTRLQKVLKTTSIIVKLGARGSAYISGDHYLKVPGKKVGVVDAVGAGDAFFAALGTQQELSDKVVRFANDWGALAVTMSGTEPPRRAMLKLL